MLKKIVSLILSIACLMGLFVGISAVDASAATSYTTGKYVISEKIGVNLRSGAGTGYTKLGAVPYNTTVQVTSVKNDWGKITYGSKTGWICLQYAKKVASTSSTSTTAATISNSLYTFTGISYKVDGKAYRQAKLMSTIGSSSYTAAGTLFWVDSSNNIVTATGTINKLQDMVLINQLRSNFVSILKDRKEAADGLYDVFTAWSRIGSFGSVMGASLGVAVGATVSGGISLADVSIEVLGTVADPQNVCASAYLGMVRVYATNVINCADAGIQILQSPITSYDEAQQAMRQYALVAANQVALEHLAGEQVQQIANSKWYHFTAHYLCETINGFADAVLPDITAVQITNYIVKGSINLADFAISTGVTKVYEQAFQQSNSYLGRSYAECHKAAAALAEAAQNYDPHVAYGLQSKINQLKNTYKAGTKKNYYEKAKAYQCHGFACEAMMLLWNTGKPTPSNKQYTYYKATSSKSNVDKIRPGDMVRYRNGNYDHTIVITAVTDDGFHYADCNGNGQNTIAYNKFISRDKLDGLMKKALISQEVATRGYICHYKDNNL